MKDVDCLTACCFVLYIYLARLLLGAFSFIVFIQLFP